MEEEKTIETNEELVDADFEDIDDDDEVDTTEEEENEDSLDEETSKVEEKSKSKDTEKKAKQSRKENAKYAELRRKNAELERENKELKTKVSTAHFDGRKNVVSQDTLDALGLERIEDEDDLFRCEIYEKAIKDDVDNPLKEVERAYAQKIKEEKKRRTQEVETQEKNEKLLRDDQIAFKKKFGFETSEALNDKRFMALFQDRITYGNLTELYTRYNEVFSAYQKEEENKAKVMGKIPNSNSKPQPKKESINDIASDEDFLKAYDALYHNRS